MAEVLEAESLGEAGFVRRVAIKRMLAAASDDPVFVAMFLDEARIASRLHHANIVAVLDYGVVDGAPFQVLELVDGLDARTLVRRAPEGRLPVDIALYLTAQVGHALASAHEARDGAGAPLGIVHRDVSPANVLVSWDGDVKIADFGIAFAKDKAEKTEAGTTKGTLTYMAPEQATTGRVDARADVFSLGCVLHTLVTGTSPLAGERFMRFLERQQLELDSSLPPDVHDIVEMATRYAPERRFQSAVALTEAVGQALAARSTREPRRRLVEFLGPSRAARKPQGRLDALMRVDLLLASTSDAASREFRTATVSPDIAVAPTETGLLVPYPNAPLSSSTADAVPPVVLGTARGQVDAPPTLASQPLSSRAPGKPPTIAVLAALIVAIVGGVGGWLLWTARSSRKPSTASVVAAAPSAPIASASAVVSVDAPLPTAPTASPSTASSAPPALHTLAGSRSASARPTPLPSTTPTAATSPGCAGALYFSCPIAPRSVVEIDGRPTTFHHGDFAELSCASHTITFRSDDGRHAERATLPTSAHTRTAPLEVRCGFTN